MVSGLPQPPASQVTWYERERDTGVVTDRWLRAARSELPEAPATVFVTVDEPLGEHGSGRGGQQHLAGLGRWLGLPEEPPRWCWFGAAYTGALQEPTGRRWWPRPRRGGGDALPELEPVAGGGLWAGGAWVPRAMRRVEAGLEPHDQQADVIPSAVAPGRPVWAGARRLRDW